MTTEPTTVRRTIEVSLDTKPVAAELRRTADALNGAADRIDPSDTAATGVALIAGERARQQTDEGYTVEHDLDHDQNELGRAAYGYMIAASLVGELSIPEVLAAETPEGWPWDFESWKPDIHDAVPNLVKAGALIAAEIDRRLAGTVRATESTS